MKTSWHLLQLADSGFPTGGFAHSNGLEAALQQGEVRDVVGFEKFLRDALWQAGRGALPLASAAHEDPGALARLDALCDVFLSSHVANRASRVMGRTFLSTCKRSLGIGEQVRSEGLHQHHAPLYGAVMHALGIELETMQQLYLYGALRGVVSAAIRLGVLGPYQAQTVQWEFSSVLDEIVSSCGSLRADDLAQTAPLLDLFQANHDRLYSKLFQS